MKFNPSTGRLFTADNRLLKQLSCPYRIAWDSLEPIPLQPHNRLCVQCHQEIIDTANYTETELATLLKENSGACLKISLQQTNLIITADEGL